MSAPPKNRALASALAAVLLFAAACVCPPRVGCYGDQPHRGCCAHEESKCGPEIEEPPQFLKIISPSVASRRPMIIPYVPTTVGEEPLSPTHTVWWTQSERGVAEVHFTSGLDWYLSPTRTLDDTKYYKIVISGFGGSGNKDVHIIDMADGSEPYPHVSRGWTVGTLQDAYLYGEIDGSTTLEVELDYQKVKVSLGYF